MTARLTIAAAFVATVIGANAAQDGCRRIPAGAEAVFLGGSDEFKLGAEGRAGAEAAKASGRWLHVGRVNTLGRLRYAAHDLCADSVDGTTLAHGPDHNLPNLLRWLELAERHGLACHDLIVHNAGTGPGGHNIVIQRRARRAHSYLLVLAHRGPAR